MLLGGGHAASEWQATLGSLASGRFFLEPDGTQNKPFTLLYSTGVFYAPSLIS